MLPTLGSDSAFDDRMDALAREIGERGRADAVLPHEHDSLTLREELEGLKPSALRRRARSAGATQRQVETADDAEVSKAAMIDLIVALSGR